MCVWGGGWGGGQGCLAQRLAPVGQTLQVCVLGWCRCLPSPPWLGQSSQPACSPPPLHPPRCRGLFEEHKQLFAFLLCTSILRHPSSGAIGPAEWSFLLRGPTGGDKAAAPNPAQEWLQDGGWRAALFADSHLEGLKGLAASIASDPRAWRAW
jgi:hypothetical protein